MLVWHYFRNEQYKTKSQFDQTEIDDALEADRFEERAFGGDLKTRKDEDLFVIDRAPKQKQQVRSKFYHVFTVINKIYVSKYKLQN